MIEPASIQQLSSELRSHSESDVQLDQISLARLNKVVRHTPHDMTATVECGISLGEVQRQLASSNQWLPIDPPNPESLAIKDLLDRDVNGPRRFGLGTARDWVIGMTAVLRDGRVFRSGGNVVKNVAGYDLHKLLIGSNGDLAIIAEATFKVSPRPEQELFVSASFDNLDSACDALDVIWERPVIPHVLDLFSFTANVFTLVVGFCGSSSQVEWQRGRLSRELAWQESGLEHDESRLNWSEDRELQQIAVAPSKLRHALSALAETQFIARAGNGTVYFRGAETRSCKRNSLDTELRRMFGTQRNTCVTGSEMAL